MRPFEQYCAREAMRQTLRGHKVPLAKEPYAHSAWRAEALTRFNALNGIDNDGAPADPHLRNTAAQVTTADHMANLRNSATNTATSMKNQCVPSLLPSSAANEVAEFLRCLELLVRISFLDPGDTAVTIVIRSMKDSVQTMANRGVLGFDDSSYPNVFVLHELWCLRRMLANWSQLKDNFKRDCIATGLAFARLFRGPAMSALEAALTAAVDWRSVDPALLSKQVDAAALEVPTEFTDTMTTLRVVYGDGTRLNARGETILLKEPCAVRVVPPPCLGEEDDQSQGKNSVTAVASSSGDSIEDVDNVDVLQGGDEGRKTVPLRRVPEVPQQLAGGDVREESPDACLRQVLGLEPPAKKPRFDLLTGHLSAGPGPAKASAVAASCAAAASKSRAVNSGVVVVTSSAFTVTDRDALGIRRPTASTHQYPCASKYHNKYSSEAKHGSRECKYCVVCHMLEFLFNGCQSDCVWKHEPTSRKISQHLKGFPDVFRLASQRFGDWVVDKSKPMPAAEIPL